MTPREARDEIFTLLQAQLEATDWSALAIDPPKVYWQGQEEVDPKSFSLPYLRAVMLHRQSRQASLAGAGGTRRWERSGNIYVQCFGPLNSGKGLTIAESLATIVRDAFEGRASPGGIWFRNCKANEVSPSEGWFQFNVVIDFLYDEVK